MTTRLALAALILASLQAGCGSSQRSWEDTQGHGQRQVAVCKRTGRNACATAGDWLVGELRLDEARAAYRRGCETRDAWSCERGIAALDDRELYAKACEHAPAQCERVAASLPSTDPQFLALLERTCHAHGPACVRLFDKLAREQHPDRARYAHEVCATADDTSSCRLLARHLWRDPEIGPALAEVACTAGDGASCWRLAGTTPDPAEAAALARRACELRDADACAGHTREQLRAACRANDVDACRALGRAVAAE